MTLMSGFVPFVPTGVPGGAAAAVQKHLCCIVVFFESPVRLPLKHCGT